MTGRGRRAWLAGLLAVLCLTIGGLELTGTARLNPAVPAAEASASQIAAATGGVYISLRIINAALSVAQETEIGAAFGAQASVQPLQVLEPVDDTVERVADVVFAVAAGAALMGVGLAPVAALGMVVLGLGLAMRCAFLAHPKMAAMAPPARQAVRLGLALALVLPLGFSGGVWMGERMTQPQWAAAVAQLDRVTGEAAILTGMGSEDGTPPVAEAATGGFLDRLNGAVDAVGRYRDAAGLFLSEADTIFGATLTIIGIFALRMLVLPAILLWGAMTLPRRSVGGGG